MNGWFDPKADNFPDIAFVTDQLIQFKVRVVPSSWWPRGRSLVHDHFLYSDAVSLDEANALFALYDPTDELLRFRGPKAWYTYEPIWHNHYRKHPIGRRLVQTLAPSEWLHFANPNPDYRVPSITFSHELSRPRLNGFRSGAVAAVNYNGGKLWPLKPHIWLRNRMILEPRVELYGRRSHWEKFRLFPALWRRGLPKNYRGETGLTHLQDEYIRFLSRYKVYVCMENSCEPYFFTEKLVNAARAGCIPVYHAHRTVAEKYLKGARWVDPQDHGFSARRTLDHALAADISEFQGANDRWLDSGILNEMGFRGFWNRIHSHFKAKLTSEPALPLSVEAIHRLDSIKG